MSSFMQMIQFYTLRAVTHLQSAFDALQLSLNHRLALNGKKVKANHTVFSTSTSVCDYPAIKTLPGSLSHTNTESVILHSY